MIPFSKYEGAGNDFILIDDRHPSFNPELVPAMCRRSLGVGADGVILLQNSEKGDFRMRIFNADGSEAEGCGNGTRCLVRFIVDLGFKPAPLKIEIHDRILSTFFDGDRVGIELGEPRNLSLNLPIYSDTRKSLCHAVDTGVPHLISFVEELSQIDLEKEAPPLRHHRAFGSRGTNVSFAELHLDRSISARTFERGVEGETLACGTGGAAIAVVAAHLFDLPSPIQIRFKGGDLTISFSDRGLKNLCLIGPARKVFSGIFYP